MYFVATFEIHSSSIQIKWGRDEEATEQKITRTMIRFTFFSFTRTNQFKVSGKLTKKNWSHGFGATLFLFLSTVILIRMYQMLCASSVTQPFTSSSLIVLNCPLCKHMLENAMTISQKKRALIAVTNLGLRCAYYVQTVLNKYNMCLCLCKSKRKCVC